MKLIRIVFFGLAVLLPVSWTVAKAADEAPAEEGKKPKKGKKAKKADKGEGDTKKAE
jgi:hypothetical protein